MKGKIGKQLQSSKARKELAISMLVVGNIIPRVQGARKTSIKKKYVKDEYTIVEGRK